jgi:hypothetical protein
MAYSPVTSRCKPLHPGGTVSCTLAAKITRVARTRSWPTLGIGMIAKLNGHRRKAWLPPIGTHD